MCLLSFLKWGSIGYPLRIVQWDFTRRDHPGNPGKVSGSGPVIIPLWEKYLQILEVHQEKALREVLVERKI